MPSSLVIPDALLKTLLPRRSIPGSATPPAEASARKILVKIAAAFLKPKYKGSLAPAAIYEAGTHIKQEPELIPVRKAAHALVSQLSLTALGAAEIDVLAAAERMVGNRDVSLIPAIAFTRGPSDAVRVAARAGAFKTASNGNYTKCVFVVSGTSPFWHMTEGWNSLRHAVCAASEKEYAVARKTAQALREKKDLPERAPLAYAFPDETWATEDLRELANKGSRDCNYLISATTNEEALRAYFGKAGFSGVAAYAIDLVRALPAKAALALFAEALPPLLVKPKHGPLLKTPPRAIAEAIACYRSVEAAALLAPYAANTILAPIVLGYFRDAPELGSALEEQAKGKGKLGETVDRVLGKAKTKEKKTPIAKASAIPRVLRDRPWRAKKGKKEADAPLTLALVGEELGRVVIREKPRPFVPYGNSAIRDMTKRELETWRALVSKGEYACADYAYYHDDNNPEYARVPDASAIWAWNEGTASLKGGARLFVARYGLQVLPGFLKRNWFSWLEYESDDDTLIAAQCLVTPAMAPTFARLAARRKRYRRQGLAWLLEYAEVAAVGLVPDALGPLGEARSDAEDALLYLVQRGLEDVVRKAAKRYGREAEMRIAERIARDPLAIDVHVPKPPAFLRVADLPKVRLASQETLDDDAQAALVELLQIAAVDPPYSGVALVREACDAESLGNLALELTEQWVLGDAPGRHDWMAFAMIHFPSIAGTRRMAALAREWARKNQAKAERACTVLAALGTDLALLHLSHIAETTRFDALKKTTAGLLLEVAAARGLSADELADRTVPDSGLDPDGTLSLSYGSRAFVVSLDETLRPWVFEKLPENKRGERLKTLPRPRKTDDEKKATEARARFDALASDLESIATRQLRRLERAMVTGRSWSVVDFTGRILAHPLLLHVARRLVWESTGAKPDGQTFRVAEDGTFADESDRVIALKGEGRIRIAHPAETPALITAWSRVFSDYEILQPFEQIGRTTFTRTAAEAKAKDLARTSGVTVKATRIMGILESRGWDRDSAGHVSAYLRKVHGEDGSPFIARLPITPGITMEDLADGPDQETSALAIEADSAGETEGGPKTVKMGALSKLAFSEIIRDVEALRGA